MAEWKRGTVKFWSRARADDKPPFGFIRDDESNTDYYCHPSRLRRAGVDVLRAGHRVRFSVRVNPHTQKQEVDELKLVNDSTAPAEKSASSPEAKPAVDKSASRGTANSASGTGGANSRSPRPSLGRRP